MKTIAIHGREIQENSRKEVQSLLENLTERSVKVILSSSFLKDNTDHFNLQSYDCYRDDLKTVQVDCVFSLGGDGTLLETVTHVGSSGIPILGINTGRLGFLATTAKEAIPEAMDLLFSDRYELEERSLVELESPGDLFAPNSFALNEFAVLRKETSSMITVKVYFNGEYLNTYWADGLMVSTPTGSTGYSLSCGGPILMPSSKNFVITPVSPHNLNIRPMVIPDNGELRFKIDSRATNLLISLDSRSDTVSHNLEICIRKSDFSINVIQLEGSSFINTLRNKLGWGFDKRN